ncbi:FAD-dependent oxidoreductase [Paenarthrobacter nitroguajacolicus]|uniref:FAD-dependent oxidoreductase n=1 Tax=Paenarthrobacter nitroguajacolicus TaxID=211146 RepID=A0A558GNB7_PAENT|nr:MULTISPECIES: FAD-dependent oxidoreductase [Paenarthrobacter]MCM0616869.1 FAD-dependent oxidoreductase [Paenarthrobacter sp. TYUT067]TVU58375.1 FAD-dependent oxidoreductase [Paenarthrobacter nitroguajacolicus]
MHTVVIGGGVIGLTQAYHLAREGETVTVIDARATGLGASKVNAGWICPAESAPVPGPGVVLKSMKWMLRPDSPLYIKPSLQPDFLKFMFGMWRKSNARDQRAGFEGHLRLAADTLGIFDEYRADGMDFELHTDGLLMAFMEKDNFDHHIDNLDLASQYGRQPKVLDRDAVHEQEPLLTDGVLGGIYFPQERHLDPGAMATALYHRLLAMGVKIVENSPIDTVERNGDRVTAVQSGGNRYTADNFVLAAGAWSGNLSKQFGVALPVRPGKGYSVEVPALGLRSAVNLWDAKVAVTPFNERLRLAGTMEFGGLDEKINQVRVDAILRAPAKYFRNWEPPSTKPAPMAGMRPMTPDGLPVIGHLGQLQNTFVSTGHGMMGITLAPGTASALTDLILKGRAASTLQPFRADRFRGVQRQQPVSAL